MLAQATSAATVGVDAVRVRVEVDVSPGLPHVLVVGLPDAAVTESRQRVRSAVRNSDLPFPAARVLVNLAPADLRKEGPAFDLPIALALLRAQQALPPEALEGLVASGELALDGSLRPVRGTINVALFALHAGYRRVLVPPGNAAEVAELGELDVWAPATLREAARALRTGRAPPLALTPSAPHAPAPAPPDLAEVRGQPAARRALEIAAVGGHHLLLTGPPGVGKSMLAQRLPSLLPPLTRDEAIEATRIHSSAGALPAPGLLAHRPFRAPHHSIPYAALVGGGATPRPGEISLAHRGVLYLDEMPEFSRRSLEVLRQPLEEGVIRLDRTRASVTLPARFMLVASRNPCPCGHHGDATAACTCTPHALAAYARRLGGPLLDRIDLHVPLPRQAAGDLLGAARGEASAPVAARVARARELARARQGGLNALLQEADLERHVPLRGDLRAHVAHLAEGLALSARGVARLRRVARSVADLAGEAAVEADHLTEAAAFRGGTGVAAP